MRAKIGRKHITVFVLILLIGLALGGALLYIRAHYTVRSVTVDGATHYTNDEIVRMVMNNALSRNSLFLDLYYRDRSIEDVPFVERMDVEITAPDAVRITVYEKSIAGYLTYLGKYVYFDREGIVVEISEEETAGIPEVLGLSPSYAVLYEPLPVDDTAVFRRILDITQQMEKNGITAERIFFDRGRGIHLFFGDIEVDLGTNDALEEIFATLPEILAELRDKKGVLRMKDYREAGDSFIFENR